MRVADKDLGEVQPVDGEVLGRERETGTHAGFRHGQHQRGSRQQLGRRADIDTVHVSSIKAATVSDQNDPSCAPTTNPSSSLSV